MNLQIRDPRARELAEELAALRNNSMTEAVIEALEAELKRLKRAVPLKDRVDQIVRRLHAQAKGVGKDMDRDEIDRMWGHD